MLNAAVGDSVAPANDSTRGVTAFFAEYKSKAPGLQNTSFIDAPGLNDPNLPLDLWIERYNEAIKLNGGKAAHLCVAVIKF